MTGQGPGAREGKVDDIRPLKYNNYRSFLGSSTVEQPAVNRRVAGSSPARGAKAIMDKYGPLFEGRVDGATK